MPDRFLNCFRLKNKFSYSFSVKTSLAITVILSFVIIHNDCFLYTYTDFKSNNIFGRLLKKQDLSVTAKSVSFEF